MSEGTEAADGGAGGAGDAVGRRGTALAASLGLNTDALAGILRAEAGKHATGKHGQSAAAGDGGVSGGGAAGEAGEKDPWGRENTWRSDRFAFARGYADGFSFECADGTPLLLHESAATIGTRVWDAALLTSRYFERCAAAAAGHEGADALPVSARWGLLSAEWWASRRVLEYGAGTGLVGLALSHLPHGCAPAAVCLTDLRVVLSNLRANAAANAPRSDSSDGSGAAGGAATEVTVAELSWGSARDERAVHEALQPNMALGSDLACPVSVIPLLVKSLESFFAFAAANGTRDPCAIFAVNSKRECTPTFLSLCEERWAVERLPTSELHPKFTSEFTSVLRLTPTGS